MNKYNGLGFALPWYLIMSRHNPECPRKAKMRTRTFKFSVALFPWKSEKPTTE